MTMLGQPGCDVLTEIAMTATNTNNDATMLSQGRCEV